MLFGTTLGIFFQNSIGKALISALDFSSSLYDALFERNSTAIVNDFEELQKQSLTGEARFKGARRVKNLFTYPNDLTQYRWIEGTGSSVSDFETVTFSANQYSGVFEQNTFNPEIGDTYVISVTAQSISGDGEFRLVVPANRFSSTLQATGTKQRFSFEYTWATNDTPGVTGVMNSVGATIKTIKFTDLQVEKVTGQTNQNPSEFTLPQWQNKYLEFDGVDDYINLGANSIVFNTDNGFTISSIIRYKGQDGIILGLSIYEDSAQYIQFKVLGGKIVISYRTDSGGERIYTSTLVLINGQEYNVLVSRDNGNEIKIDINGNIETFADTAGNIGITQTVASTFVDAIGSWRGGNTFYKGSINSLNFYNAVKTKDSLDDNDLIAKWSLSEGEGSITYDSSGNENHGTLTNFGLFPKYYGTENGNTVDGNGVVTEAVGSNIAESTLQGVLIEKQSTNISIYSANLENWIKTQATITQDAIASPMGDSSMDVLVEDATNNIHYITEPNQKTFISGLYYTSSVYVKAKDRDKIGLYLSSGIFTNNRHGWFDLSTGTIGALEGTLQGGIKAQGNGFYKIWITGIASANAIGRGGIYICKDGALPETYLGDGVSGIYAWGFQVEQSKFPTSYIQTLSSTVTRIADKLSLPKPDNFNDSKGSIDITAQSNRAGANDTYWVVDFGNATGVYQDTDGLLKGTDGTNTIILGASSDNGTLDEIHFEWTPNTLKGKLNDIDATPVNFSGNMNSGDTFYIGRKNDNTSFWNGTIKRFDIYK